MVATRNLEEAHAYCAFKKNELLPYEKKERRWCVSRLSIVDWKLDAMNSVFKERQGKGSVS